MYRNKPKKSEKRKKTIVIELLGAPSNKTRKKNKEIDEKNKKKRFVDMLKRVRNMGVLSPNNFYNRS